jgi:hypothetical protein
MSPPASSSSHGHSSSPAKDGRREIASDVLWGRPVLRPPQLINPQIAFDPLPFRTQSFMFQRAASGR